MIERLAIIGVGLIGGSLARALKRARACSEVIGCGRDPQSLERAVDLGVIDGYQLDPVKAVEGADMVVLGVPVGTLRAVMTQIAPHLSSRAVLTDVGSVKGCVVEDARAVLAERLPCFVPAHPVAGAEKSGVDASFAELFERRRVVLTPLPETDTAALQRVTWMWRQSGALVETMAVGEHDRLLAATSHLPHVLAYAYMHTLAGIPGQDGLLRLASSGFSDFTRIASSNTDMWHDIVVSNRAQILAMVDGFPERLGGLGGGHPRGG